MVRKLAVAASRNAGVRLFRWSVFLLAGVTGGMMLGEMAVGTSLGRAIGEPVTYSHLSANPGALAPEGDASLPCRDCLDSYGVAVRLRAHREDRMNDEFRALGAVNPDPVLPDDLGDAYRFGGRFPDPGPSTATANVGEEIPAEPAGGTPFDENEAPLAGEY